MLIGIIGKKQVGKDTVAKILTILVTYGKDVSTKFIIEHLNNYESEYVEIRPIAHLLKKTAATLLGTSVKRFYDEDFKKSELPFKYCKTVRALLQILGTEIGKQIDPDIWINDLISYYKHTFNKKYLIVPDVRFRNEAKGLKDSDKDCVLIRVTRNTGYIDNHSSETDLDDYKIEDYHIENNDSLEELIELVRTL